MPAINRTSGGARATRAACGLLTLVAVGFGVTAQAGLGDSADSIARDHTALQAQTETHMAMAAYDRHEITTASGTRVREYVSKAGKVFAVSWRGTGLPDLAQLLGAYATQLAQAQPRTHYNHHHLRIETPEVVMQSDAYLRNRSGRAWVPALFPQNLSPKDIG